MTSHESFNSTEGSARQLRDVSTFKLNAEFEIPAGYVLILTLKPTDPTEPEQPLPPNPTPALRAAA